jgi:uncharacterized protein
MERKIVQIDCRPSDCISMAVRAEIPIFFEKNLWHRQPDLSGLLRDLKSQIEEENV